MNAFAKHHTTVTEKNKQTTKSRNIIPTAQEIEEISCNKLILFMFKKGNTELKVMFGHKQQDPIGKEMMLCARPGS